MRFSKGLLAAVLLISALPMFGAWYIKFDGVDGESTAAGHEKWIELGSVQFQEGSCAMAGQTVRLRIASTNNRGRLPASLDQACRSQTPYRNVIVEGDGQRHVLQNVKLACPTTPEAPLELTFQSCQSHPPSSWPQKVEIGALKAGATATQRPTTTLEGLTRQPLVLIIRRANIVGNTATVALVGGAYSPALGAAIMEATAKGKSIDPMVIKADGQQWTFSKAMFTSASFPAGQDAIFTFEFQAMNGSLPAFQALGGN